MFRLFCKNQVDFVLSWQMYSTAEEASPLGRLVMGQWGEGGVEVGPTPVSKMSLLCFMQFPL